MIILFKKNIQFLLELMNAKILNHLSDYVADEDIQKSSKEGLPFIDPTNPSLRSEAITLLIQKAKKEEVIFEYDYRYTYLNFYKYDILNSKSVEFDQTYGIPVNKYFHIDKPKPYPVTIGLYGLECISKYYRHRNGELLKYFVQVCDWALINQNEIGAWPVPFPYEFFKGRSGGTMQSGWISALGQAYILSSLSRYLIVIKEKKIEIANNEEIINNIIYVTDRGINPFERDVLEGGIARKFIGKHLFFEEYPTPKPSFVLNGFMFALLALYDVYKIFNNKRAENLYKEGIKTLQVMLPFFDLGDRTAYDLTHLSTGNESYPPNPARKAYHQVHLTCLSALNSIEGGIFDDILSRWILYFYGVISPNNC